MDSVTAGKKTDGEKTDSKRTGADGTDSPGSAGIRAGKPKAPASADDLDGVPGGYEPTISGSYGF
ncbi:hypothetical protein ACFOGJ_27350 [Marinibaculum pumilum]|uniref:Uncharacterized protein n=1 Tax=Marinibaculum pumilum TaxID=1766165 RepID=A0ABV7L8Q0_9PROT